MYGRVHPQVIVSQLSMRSAVLFGYTGNRYTSCKTLGNGATQMCLQDQIWGRVVLARVLPAFFSHYPFLFRNLGQSLLGDLSNLASRTGKYVFPVTKENERKQIFPRPLSSLINRQVYRSMALFRVG